MFSTTIRISLLLCVLYSSPIFSEEQSIVITNGEYRPYSSEGMLYGGVMSHIVKEAFSMGGVDITYEFLPWNRSYETAKNGYRNGTCCWYQTEERDKFFYFSEPIMADKVVFIHRKDFDFNWNSMQDLKGLKVGVVGTQSYGNDFDNALKQGDFLYQRTHKEELNLKKVVGERIHLTPINVEVAYELINNNLTLEEGEQLTHHPKFVTIDYLRLALSKKAKNSRDLMDTFNSGLQKMKARGLFEKFISESRQGKYDSNRK